ncbi:hypothetical protein O181_034027 [Austropuccinia psidii MF-1]|uniref:alpha,alpha-trehalase n=1 Tax=Austropuccinia psidii MF-1 TaxID=1389203 RepID=A0A9Q3D5T5_9BASI|nr:hypothetical protein [Austropuccinia psidii MF-1]
MLISGVQCKSRHARSQTAYTQVINSNLIDFAQFKTQRTLKRKTPPRSLAWFRFLTTISNRLDLRPGIVGHGDVDLISQQEYKSRCSRFINTESANDERRLKNSIQSRAEKLHVSSLSSAPYHLLPSCVKLAGVQWDNENWRLVNTLLSQGQYQSRTSLANGYFGINLAALGPFFEKDLASNSKNNWPLLDPSQAFATIAGFFDSQTNTTATNFPWLNQYGQESVISGVPHWAGLVIKNDNHILNASTSSTEIHNFRSTFDFKTGLREWNYDWKAPGQPTISIKYTIFLHKLHLNQATVRLELIASENLELSVIDILEGDCAVRTDFVAKDYDPQAALICSAVKPIGISDVTAHICSALRSHSLSSTQSVHDQNLLSSHPSSIAQGATIRLLAAQITTIEKFIGVASTDAFSNPKMVARQAALAGANHGFIALANSHAIEWQTVLPSHSVDNFSLPANDLDLDLNLVELQILAVTNSFYLLQNTLSSNAIAAATNDRPLNIWSISVGGLGSSSYGGQFFWDTEVFMGPGLVVTHPDAVQQTVNYRVEKFPQAQENVKMSFTSSQNTTKFSGGAVYPWTSGRFGNCTGVGPCFDYEYHINGDIGLSLFNFLVATGNIGFFHEKLFPIYDSIATFFSQLLKFDPRRHKYILTNATDPDEYANHIDNPAFTMALIKTHLQTAIKFRSRFGIPQDSTWSHQIDNIAPPTDEDLGIILEYEGMNSSISVKQADVVLIDDFLDYPNPYSLKNLDYYATRQSPMGPAMTYAIYSIINNRLAPQGCSSYTYDLYGHQPYARAPWFQFSETISDNDPKNPGVAPAFPFLTGMGSAYRVSLYGYLGLRLRLDFLNIDPSLPPQIPSITYRTFYWQGHPIKAYSNRTHTLLIRPKLVSLPQADPLYRVSPIPVKIGSSSQLHQLDLKAPLTVLNRVPIFTDPLQCQPIKSQQTYFPGQFPVSLTDGSSATKWSPSVLPATITAHTNPAFSSKSIVGFALQNSNITDFSITFFDEDSQNIHEYKSTEFALGKNLKRDTKGWTNYTISPTIKCTKFVNLTIFHHSTVPSLESAQNFASIAELKLLTL